MADPASYESWKRRRLAAGAPLSSIEAMQPKPVQGASSTGFKGFTGTPTGPAGQDMMVSLGRDTSAPAYMPTAQSFNYPQSPQASAPGEGFAPPGTSMSLKNDVMDMGEMLPGMQGQGFSPQDVPGIFQGGSSPFAGPSTPNQMPGIPPGALAKPQGFDPRFPKPPQVGPLWR